MKYRQRPYSLTIQNEAGLDTEVVGRLVECWRDGYPRMAARFNPAAAKSVHLRITDDYPGPGETEGDQITLGAAHFRAHPWDSDVMTHELFHVVQAYEDFDGPHWAMEGLADYARFHYGRYNREGSWYLPEDLTADASYRDSYRVSARFLVWLEKHVRGSIAEELDGQLRAGTYSDSFWAPRSLDEFWSDYLRDPRL
jgi:hypothetical protein